jgi:hypothetical protein
MRVPYYIVIEEQEYSAYSAVINPSKILILDKSFQRNYDTYDDLGDTKSKGPGPARNFAWEHSKSLGAKWHWVMDDNIRYFFRFNKNMKIPVGDGTIFRAMENFVQRYTNIGMAGPHYHFFAWRKRKLPPYIINNRIYSCNLIRNDLPFRWRGRYNEDTDLSLVMLKAGWCTVSFFAFLQGKTATQLMKGGNTDDFYAKEGTDDKSKMLVNMHPDVSRLAWKWGRCHHHVDYRGFKTQLILRDDLKIVAGNDDMGMQLKKIK